MYYLSKNKIKIETSSLKGRFFYTSNQPDLFLIEKIFPSFPTFLFVC